MTGPVIRAVGSGFISRSDDVPDPVALPQVGAALRAYLVASSASATANRQPLSPRGSAAPGRDASATRPLAQGRVGTASRHKGVDWTITGRDTVEPLPQG